MLVRLTFFLLLILPPMALAADAPPNGGKITVIAQPSKAAAPAPTPPPMSPAPVTTAAAPADASSCRMDCAQSYYTCRVDDQTGTCAGGWSQCVAACNTPNLAPPYSAAP